MTRWREGDSGVSDTLGAVILVAVVGLAVSLVGLAIVSPPSPQNPAVSAELITFGNTIQLRHNGGDPLMRNDLKILVDGADLTGSFLKGDGGTWSVWSIGDTLTYNVPVGQSRPKNIQLVYTGVPSGSVLQSWVVP
ncbi:type IV pilin N-terminal domain-containing protein [Methanoregula sp.]|uniref:type IV pilin N-terminal domain-containing protein n=1 Tax=Methanoregula sp. TaxID=2052170 RepID=UPI00356A6E2A